MVFTSVQLGHTADTVDAEANFVKDQTNCVRVEANDSVDEMIGL